MTATEPVTPETAYERTAVSIERAGPDRSGRRGADHAVSFAQPDSRHIEFLTQGELIDLWQQIGAYFNLAGMGDAQEAARDSGSEKGKSARFADFYTARYDDYGSTARALIVETDEPMQIRPVSDRSVIIARA
jgi:hypothetical protein